MKTKLKENRKTIVGIVLLVVMVIGFSYAWFQLTLRGEKENVLKAGTLSLILDDTMGDGISIENGVPVTDEDGKKMVPYTFTLENNGTLDSDYTIYLDDLDLLEGETRMPDSVIKYYLTKDGSDLGLDLLSVTGENPNRILDSGVIAPGEKYTYTLRLWIADTATNEIMGTTFRGQVRVEAIQAASKAFAVYSDDDKSLRFYNRTGIPNVGETYEELTATAVYQGIEQLEATAATEIPWNSYATGIEKVVVVDEISPTSTTYWFYKVGYDATTLEMDLSKLDTSNVTSMPAMFQYAGSFATTLSIVGLSNWDTSNVTDMSGMFYYAGNFAKTWSIGDLSNWDTSNVTDMSAMFQYAGYNATTWSIGDISGWNTSKVTDMNAMFYRAGMKGTTFELDLSNWDTSKVNNMRGMFHGVGLDATTFVLDLSNWNTSSVTTMTEMFYSAGYNATTFELDLSNWDTSNVTAMGYMFNEAGYNATTWSIGDLSNWDTSNVTTMTEMFYSAGYNATTFELDLSKWDTSNVTAMKYMFNEAGYNATTWSIGDLSNWDTSNVTDMSGMFASAGNSATYTLDLSGWNVPDVTSYTDFNANVETKVTAPTWVN